jgi:hypothetical protein
VHYETTVPMPTERICIARPRPVFPDLPQR